MAESLPLLREPLAASPLPTLATVPECLPTAKTPWCLLKKKETKQNPCVLGLELSHVTSRDFLSKAPSREFSCLGARKGIPNDRHPPPPTTKAHEAVPWT